MKDKMVESRGMKQLLIIYFSQSVILISMQVCFISTFILLVN